VKKAYQLIEELMLLANEVVAGWLAELKVPTIYRVHGAPDETKLDRLGAMCEALGVEFDADDARDPKKLAALVRRWNEHPLAQVLNMLLLRSMKQASYSVANVGHFGLASTAYLHFTSPIRRYPDLVVHRGVHAALGGRVDRSADGATKLEQAALDASAAERRAMEIEREVADLYRAALMQKKVGEEIEGIVTAVVGSGVFVALDSPFVDVLVRAEDLGDDAYEIDDEGLRATGRRSGDVVRLGDRMLVRIVDVSIVRRTVYGRRVSAPSPRKGREKREKRKEWKKEWKGGPRGRKPGK
jgi:ribonuclease R